MKALKILDDQLTGEVLCLDCHEEAIKELEEIQRKESLIKEVLFEVDLETNFNGYPLENSLYYSDDIRECLCENEFKRFHKNKNYKLKLIIEEY